MGASNQRGIGLVEVLVASAILGIALSVMLGNLGTLLVGARVADRRTGEERLVRNQIEDLQAQPAPPAGTCPRNSSRQETIDLGTAYPTKYWVMVEATCSGHYLEYKVTASDRSGGQGVKLSVGRYQP